jgi:hypothetical protein
VTEDKRIITVTEEEYQVIMQLRERLKAEGAPVEDMPELPGGMRGPEFAMGAVAGMAAYWLYKELFEDEDESPIDVRPRKGARKGARKG